MMYDSYEDLPVLSTKAFNKKSASIKKLERECLQILYHFGIPIDLDRQRSTEKMAMAFLAVGSVKSSSEWISIKDSREAYAPTTREIIDFHNKNLEDNISSGSYDDIRRKDLEPLLQSGIVLHSNAKASTNDPRRGYQVSPEYADIIRQYGEENWFDIVRDFMRSHKTLDAILSPITRTYSKLRVTTLDGNEIELKEGEHNLIQKAVIEEFLPRFGYNAVILYCGDSNKKYGVIFEKEELKRLGFNLGKGSKLPDIIAFSQSKNWVFVIEAYHTSNPITDARRYEIKNILGSVKRVVYVTAFKDRRSYKTCVEELAWESEVWLVSEPDHLIHLNGDRFLGPYDGK